MNGAARAAALCVLIVLAPGCRPGDGSAEKAVEVRSERPVRHGKPRSPIDAKLEIVGTRGRRGGTTFLLSVTPEANFSNASIEIKLPNNSEVIDGTASWRGDLEAGTVHEMKITARIPERRQYKVVANIVFAHTAKMKLKKRVVLNVRDGKRVPPDRSVKKGHRHKAMPLKEFLKKKGG